MEQKKKRRVTVEFIVARHTTQGPLTILSYEPLSTFYGPPTVSNFTKRQKAELQQFDAEKRA